AKTPARRRGTRSLPTSVGRQILVPVSKHLEASPEARLGVFFVERVVDVWGLESVDGGGEGLDLALARLDRARERDLEVVEYAQGGLAHDDDDLRLHNRDLFDHTVHAGLGGEVGLRNGALDAEGPVDDERVDAEPLEALHQRVAGATVEG